MNDEEIIAVLSEVGAAWLMDPKEEHCQAAAIRHLVKAVAAAERESIATLLIEAAEAVERTPHGHGQAEHLRTAAAMIRARSL